MSVNSIVFQVYRRGCCLLFDLTIALVSEVGDNARNIEFNVFRWNFDTPRIEVRQLAVFINQCADIVASRHLDVHSVTNVHLERFSQFLVDDALAFFEPIELVASARLDFIFLVGVQENGAHVI